MKCEYILKKQLSCLEGLGWSDSLPVLKISGSEFLKADNDRDKFQELCDILKCFSFLARQYFNTDRDSYDYYKKWVKKSNSIVFGIKKGFEEKYEIPVWIEVAIMYGTNSSTVIEYSKDNGKHIWRVDKEKRSSHG